MPGLTMTYVSWNCNYFIRYFNNKSKRISTKPPADCFSALFTIVINHPYLHNNDILDWSGDFILSCNQYKPATKVLIKHKAVLQGVGKWEQNVQHFVNSNHNHFNPLNNERLLLSSALKPQITHRDSDISREERFICSSL